MKRIERRRVERIRRATLTIGLSFAIGALTASGLTWRNGRSDTTGPTIANYVGPVPRSGPAVPDAATPEPTPAPTATIGPAIDTVVAPADRELAMPVDGVDPNDLRDTFHETRGGNRPHEALDIIAPRGTPVRAVRDGYVEKLFTSEAGGLTIYQFDPSATYAYYYAHLDRYAAGLTERQSVRKGELIGYVGTTGNASPDAPHLHFAIFRLTPERRWSEGDPLNPYPLLQ
jgi:murein DD-endopeptidase MepM/ murein hydrolase activator NlpD